MMRFNPTLIVTRVVVNRNEHKVYDEAFHVGVNVVRGENSSGKSTVLNFIFYGLGGDLADWSTVARLCTNVTIEARVNGNMVTLSREISTSGQQPMEIFGGDYAASQNAPRSEWVRYPYKRSSNKESFSQALFHLMGIPEVASDLSGNITMHQILRLLYADQLSPIEDIFRFERFDQANLRDTVGRLLCGAYESELYDNELKIRELARDHDAISAQLKSLFSILGKTERGFTIEWIDSQKAALERDRAENQRAIEDAERKFYASAADDQVTLKNQDEAYKAVQAIQSQIVETQTKMDALALTIADSGAFISSLKSKIDALQDSSSVVHHIGEVRFQSCPACYAPIDEEIAQHTCHLCKTPFDSERTRERISSLILDLGLQIKQSERLQSQRQERATALKQEHQRLRVSWSQAAQRLAELQRLPSSVAGETLRELQKRAGYLERQAEDLEQKASLVRTIRELSDQKDRLNEEISRLRSANDALRAQQEKRLSIAYTRIADEIKILLRNDLRRQDIFEAPESVSFTFAENKISVNDERYFSASSRAILKSSFCLGFLAAATKTDFFRHPRFCMIDTLENMGVEAIRSQNFQRQIQRVSQESRVEHQIIYATAMIEPELESATFTVGALSTSADKTIGIML